MKTQSFQIPREFRGLINIRQAAAINHILRGEEGRGMLDILHHTAAQIIATPAIMANDGQGTGALARLHYFTAGCDWWISELDRTSGEAFGLCDLGMGFPELGSVYLSELISCGAELDLHFTPRPLRDLAPEHSHS